MIVVLMLVMFVLLVTAQSQTITSPVLPFLINEASSYEGNLEGTLVVCQEENETLYLGIDESMFNDKITWVRVDEYGIDPRPYLHSKVSFFMQGTTLTDIHIYESIISGKDAKIIIYSVSFIIIIILILCVGSVFQER